MITVEYTRDIRTGAITGKFEVTAKDLRDINLDPFDKMVIGSPEESAADVFQSLELLARRQLQQVEKESTPHEN